jgi:hypothetical protein
MDNEVRDELIDLMNDASRWPKSEVEALTYLLLLQWIERDFYAVERPKPKITERKLYLGRLRNRVEAVRLEVVRRHPQFESPKDYTLMLKTWKDVQTIAASVVPGSNGIHSDVAPPILADAVTELLANHMNFSRGYPALSWVKNAALLNINTVVAPNPSEPQDGQDEEDPHA